jgi:hypothetical protein
MAGAAPLRAAARSFSRRSVRQLICQLPRDIKKAPIWEIRGWEPVREKIMIDAICTIQ